MTQTNDPIAGTDAPERPPVAQERPDDVANTNARSAAIVDAILRYGAPLREGHASQSSNLGGATDWERFLAENDLAFLIGVICDQGISAERAWAVPWELKKRLGHLDPARLASEPEAVRDAFHQHPMLHRLVNVVPIWIAEAAQRVVCEHKGDAKNIWGDNPRAAVLQARLRAFKGIGQKKAAMAVEILAGDRGVPIRDLRGSDIAYDIHLRRVFLRTGLVEADRLGDMVAVARELCPTRPGSLDYPSWDIGRRWCRPSEPKCDECALHEVCPRRIHSADGVGSM